MIPDKRRETTLNITFFGSSLLSAYWNGAATYYRGLARALHERGHHVTFFEPDAYNRQDYRDVDHFDYAESVVYRAGEESDVFAALAQARHADVLIKNSGIGVFDWPYGPPGIPDPAPIWPANCIYLDECSGPRSSERSSSSSVRNDALESTSPRRDREGGKLFLSAVKFTYGVSR